jgi:hypothetical protein
MNNCDDNAVCAAWQFRQPLFYNFDLMLVVLDYLDTFTANRLNQVFTVLKMVRLEYWLNRYATYRKQYELKSGMPYRYDLRCRIIQKMFEAPYATNHHLTLNKRADDQNSRANSANPEDFQNFQTVIPGFHVQGESIYDTVLPDKYTPYQEMVIHEFYEPQERDLFQRFPSIKGPLGEHGTIVQFTYLANCDLWQSRVFAQELGAAITAYNVNNQATFIQVLRDGDKIAFDVKIGPGTIVRANYWQMRKFIHFVLPMIDEIHGLPGGYRNLATLLTLPALADKRGFLLFKFGGRPSNLIHDTLRQFRGL